MQHLEPEDIALAALGEDVADAARAHLATCPGCAAELASLRRAALAGRVAGPDALVAPPASVWHGIRDELGLGRVEDPSEAPATRPGAPVATQPPAVPGGPVPLESRRGRLATRHTGRWLAVAAAGGLVLGAGGATWWSGRGPSSTVVDQTALDALPGWPDATGTAVVREATDGTRTLVVDVAGAPTDDGLREVWLIDTGVTRLISLGLLTGSNGTFQIPADVDLAQFPVVDVSQEPLDGDPAHSGDSIVRGVLGT